MESGNFILFIAASVVIIITPGPDMIYVLTQGIARGKKAGVLSAVGVVSGLFVHTVVAAVGLGIIIATSQIAYSVVKYIGAAYLLYLGVRAIKEKAEIRINNGTGADEKKVYINGFLSNLFNPKIIVFFIAYLPQFINPSKIDTQIGLIILGLSFSVMGAVFLSIVGYAAGRIGDIIKKSDAIIRIAGKMSGGVMIGLGLRLALDERR